jgi:amino acid transporter
VSANSTVLNGETMKKLFWLVLAAGSSCFILKLSTFVIPEAICVLVSIPVLITLVVLLIIAAGVGFIVWRKSSRIWPVPALVCLAFILSTYYFTSPLGQFISDWRFERHLAEYSRVVDGLRNGTISCEAPCNADVEVIKTAIGPPHIQEIWGARCNDNGVIVDFLDGTDVPFLHEGYFFKDYGEKSNCNTRSVSPDVGWPHVPYVRHITGHWYRLSDQPGF